MVQLTHNPAWRIAMTDIAMRYKDELLGLSPDDRAALAHILWESLDKTSDEKAYEDDAAWIAELERRSADAESGRATEEPFRDVIAELRREQP
jgi:putative addiction module component (TIGR02574 family)